MGSSLTRTLLALACTFAVAGCAAESVKSTETPVEEDATSDTKKPARSGDAEDDGTLATSPVVTHDTAADETATDPAPSADPKTDPAPAPAPTPAREQTKSCTSTTGEQRSVTNVTFLVENGNITVSKMTVTVANKDKRNENDVDVYVTPSGGKETLSFNSGDILVSDKAVSLALPKTFVVKAGTKVRVSTNFDQAFTDPSASCTLQF